MKFLSKSINDTKVFATQFAKKLKIGDVVTLKGDLGAGKTTFVQFLSKALGVKDNVTSPTFTIINEYDGKFKIYHMDLYRLESQDEAMQTGFLDYVNRKDGICLIEWPQVASGLLPKSLIEITIANKGNSREFIVEGL